MFPSPVIPRRSSIRPLPLSEASDADLARALMDGEPGASRVVVERFSPLVRTIARRIIGPYGEVEDAVQDVYLNLLRSVGGLREPGALRAFVVRITSRTLVHERHRRRARLFVRAQCDDVDSFATPTAADSQTKNAWLRLQLLLERLRPRDRTTFLLYFVAGMHAPEIAGTLGVSIPTVRRSLGHARQRIDAWAQRDPFLADYLADHPLIGWTQVLIEEEAELAPPQDDAAA